MSISLFPAATSLNPRHSEPVSMRPAARTEPFLGYYCYDKGLTVVLRRGTGRTHPFIEVVDAAEGRRERVVARLVGPDCQERADRFCLRQNHRILRTEATLPLPPTGMVEAE